MTAPTGLVRAAAMLLVAWLPAGAAAAAPVPPDVARLLDDASGDAAELATVARVARRSYPQSAAEIDAQVAALQRTKEAEHKIAMAATPLWRGWTGQIEAGAFQSTGNTDNSGATIDVELHRDGPRWRHEFAGNFDFQRENGATSRRRLNGQYEGDYLFDRHFYALVTLAYDSDRFAGIDDRFVQALGLGYVVVDGGDLRVAADIGPALRQTHFSDGRRTSAIGARTSVELRWQVTTGLIFSQDATLFLDNSRNSSFASLTALTARLSSKLSARLSWRINTETDPPIGRLTRDSNSRVTLIYAF